MPVTDPAYVAWLDRMKYAPLKDTMADVEAALAEVFPRGTPRTYSAFSRWRKASGGLTVTSISEIPFLTDPTSRQAVYSAYDFVSARSGAIVQWKMSDGSFVAMDQAKLETVTNAISAFVESCFACEGTVAAGIDDGSITTLAQVDDAYAAVSNVVE